MVRTSLVDGAIEDAVARAAGVIAEGGLVALPTDTLYGLAVDPYNAEAVARLFAAKGRPEQRPIPLIAADRLQVTRAFGALTPLADRLATACWPGPLTLLLPAPAGLAPAVSAGTGQVGVRVPAHDVARALCRRADRPLTATSANRSGEPATDDPEEIARALGDRIDLLLDGGPAPGGPPSTVVDVAEDRPRLVRAGAVAWSAIEACAAGR